MNMKHLLWIEQCQPGQDLMLCVKAEGFQLTHAADLTAVLNSCSVQQPDIVVMAAELAEIRTKDLMVLLKKQYPSCQIIVLVEKDQHAVAAESLNYGAIDYLLKPVQKEELQAALQKYRQLHVAATDGKPDINLETLVKQLQQKLQPKEYRKRFLVKHAQKLVSVEIDEIAYFYSDGRLNFFKTTDNKKYVVDYTMDELEEMLDPEKYFRISRSFYVSVGSIEKIDDYFGNRLILQLKPAVDKEALVSREKVTEFKKWMGK